jgi:alkylhydroperoxidase family enzyme
MTQRLAPIEPPFAPDIAEMLARYPQRDGYLLQLFRTFANSPRFLRKAVANLLDPESPLSLRLREITILRVTANTRCEYEWGVHVTTFSRAAGLDLEQIAATVSAAPDAACWSPDESLLIQAVDEMCHAGGVSPGAYARVAQTWTLAQQLEIIALCGNYHTISFVANTARLAPEPFGARFPPSV